MTLARVLAALGVSLGAVILARWMQHRSQHVPRLQALRQLLALAEAKRIRPRSRKLVRFEDWPVANEERKRA